MDAAIAASIADQEAAGGGVGVAGAAPAAVAAGTVSFMPGILVELS